MHSMKKILSATLVSALLLSGAVPAFASGNPHKSEGAEKWRLEKFHNIKVLSKDEKRQMLQTAYDHTLKNFSFLDGKKIKVHHKHVNFDVNPIIKEGRTLIPVRAITEAMGADVKWDADTSIVTITSADEKTVIMFYLGKEDSGKVTVNGKEVTLDVKPGMVNHRTFVPMRFIAETLGFKVSHNNDTGETEIDENTSPELTPAAISFANKEILTPVTVAYSMNADFDLVNVKIGSTTVDAGDYDIDGNKVVFEKGFIEELSDDKTVLTFVFEDSKDVRVEKEFVITIDQDGVYEEPTLSKAGVTYPDPSDITDAAVSVDWNDHTLTSVKEVKDGVSTVVLNTSYIVEGNTITFKESFIRALEAGKTALTLVFEALDKELVNLEFVIEK